MSPAAAAVDWSSRPVVTALSPERLAGLIEPAQTRTDGLLFTATPAGEPRLERYLKSRDRTCVFPGCNRRTVDLDHRIPWPYGATSADNGQCLCRHHHRAKHATFTVVRNPDGSYTWTTRSGWKFHRRPKGF